jgi:hypothetical protein
MIFYKDEAGLHAYRLAASQCMKIKHRFLLLAKTKLFFFYV